LDILSLASRAGLSSSPTCQLRQGGNNDAVVQQIKEVKMSKQDKTEKLQGTVVKPSYSEDEIFEKLMGMFKKQGIEVKKNKKE